MKFGNNMSFYSAQIKINLEFAHAYRKTIRNRSIAFTFSVFHNFELSTEF